MTAGTRDAVPAVAARPERLVRRLVAYQAERFPLAAYVPLIATFTFSSAAYSRLARRAAGIPGAQGFVPWPLYAVGAFTSLTFFFMLRVLDEGKDAETDRRFRPELPVPRGLVSLAELRAVGGGALALAVTLNAIIAPILLLPFALVTAWATLMTKEFFVREWLRAHLGAYLVTHMLIMPMIDAYTTGLDWLVAGYGPPRGLAYFLGVTFANGCLVEIGRKLRLPDREREGVDSYTREWGLRAAPLVWIAMLLASATLAWRAAFWTGAARETALVVFPGAALAAIPALRFLARRDPLGRSVEVTSGVWGIVTYLTLGAGSFLARLI
jgi:hypothetical protein